MIEFSWRTISGSPEHFPGIFDFYWYERPLEGSQHCSVLFFYCRTLKTKQVFSERKSQSWSNCTKNPTVKSLLQDKRLRMISHNAPLPHSNPSPSDLLLYGNARNAMMQMHNNLGFLSAGKKSLTLLFLSRYFSAFLTALCKSHSPGKHTFTFFQPSVLKRSRSYCVQVLLAWEGRKKNKPTPALDKCFCESD